MQTPNSISLGFRSYSESTRETNINISINSEGVDDSKLLQILNTWLHAIGANLKVSPDIESRAQPLVEALQWIATVNALDREYQAVAKKALKEWKNGCND